jgi:hypothetical protein
MIFAPQSEIEREMNSLLSKALAHVFSKVEIKQGTGPAKAAFREEIHRTRDEIMKQIECQQIIRTMAEWLESQVKPATEEMWKAKREAVQARQGYEDATEKLRTELERAKAEFAALDPMTKRMRVWADSIDKVLPFKVEDERRTVYATDQVIRSRGLVMAALAGMTSVGAPPKQEDAQ